ncbi:MAG: right-handed parallel beta-helix repeat-containing protein [Candidatus Cloacimonadaceae bacterium]|jgi:polygalacturonase|nr:right-handed parallel beta-helix repeat-containing protein [Candidatus Cloacimonadota bacterium]MDX9950399.1 right-handed parallel beta-helix repeat-containing protein [Candidatus Syntrophosphaera sp.]
MRKTIVCCLTLIVVLAIAAPLTAAKPSKAATVKEVNVTNEREFLNAIGSNTVINMRDLENGYFVLSGKKTIGMSRNARYEEVFDGYQLVISDVDGLTLVGTERGLSLIMAEPRYANVITFQNCRNLRFENLGLGHTDAGYCTGGVLEFNNCQGISISNCEMWGCGMEGITASDCSGLDCELSTIYGCTYSAMTMSRVKDVSFTNCVIRDNVEFNTLNFWNCQNVEFNGCVIFDNNAFGQWGTSYLIYSEASKINFTDCAIFRNNVHELTNNPRIVRFDSCAVFKNEYEPIEDSREDEYWDYNYDEEW